MVLEMNDQRKCDLLLQLLSSSSSSSEDEFQLLQIDKTAIPKIENYVQDVVQEMNDKQFKKAFRLEKSTVDSLIEIFQQSTLCPTDSSHGGSIPISPEIQILSFLWFCSNKVCLRDVAERFNIGTTTLFRQTIRIMDFLLELGPTIIKMPSSDMQKELVAHEFEQLSGFPNVLGCIDGSYINLRKPAHKIKSTYTNRHDLVSLTMQGICDSKYRFLDVFTGIPGKIHDARVLKLSDINRRLPDICGKKYHILGDGAYSIRPWLLVSYQDNGHLTESQINYNKRHNATRVKIENTFGILKSRFRQLQSLDFHEVDKASKFILSMCVLHNFCLERNDFLPEEDMGVEGPNNLEGEADHQYRLKAEGEAKRDFIRMGFSYMD